MPCARRSCQTLISRLLPLGLCWPPPPPPSNGPAISRTLSETVVHPQVPGGRGKFPALCSRSCRPQQPQEAVRGPRALWALTPDPWPPGSSTRTATQRRSAGSTGRSSTATPSSPSWPLSKPWAICRLTLPTPPERYVLLSTPACLSKGLGKPCPGEPGNTQARAPSWRLPFLGQVGWGCAPVTG